MPRSVSLAIPQPCSESWAAMTPAAQGRHCAACDKVVLDFTQKTDAEILALLQRAASPCGRFRPDQLGRPLQAPAAPAPRWRTWLAAAATVLGLRELAAEEGRGQQVASLHAPLFTTHDDQKAALLHQRTVAESKTQPEEMALLRGRVTDKTSGEGLAGVTIMIQGTSHGVATQADGSFELPVPKKGGHRRAKVQLLINFVGYNTQKVTADLHQTSLLSIQLEATSYMLGGLSIAPVQIQTPWFRSFDLADAVRRATSRNL